MLDVIKETQIEHDIKTRSGVFENFNKGDDINTTRIQVKCKSGYYSASRVLDKLISDGIVKRGKMLTTKNKYW